MACNLKNRGGKSGDRVEERGMEMEEGRREEGMSKEAYFVRLNIDL